MSGNAINRWSETENLEVAALSASPRGPTLLLSVFVHALVLVFILAFRPTPPARVVPPQVQRVQRISGKAYLSQKAKPSPSRANPARLNQRRGPVHAANTASISEGVYSGTLREQAQKATADITMSLRFRLIYGFNRDHEYQLAVQTGGEIPVISAEEVPLHFQQYLIVEITIDTQGRVAEAQIVAGLIDPAIQQKLLSAIREFRYSPAKRDGVPIPSQRDIVIHIPS